MTSKSVKLVGTLFFASVLALAMAGCGEKEDQAMESPTAGLTATVPPPVENPKGAPKKVTATQDAGGTAAPGG